MEKQILLNKLTITTPLSSLRVKYLKQRQISWIVLFKNTSGSLQNRYLMFALNLKGRRHEDFADFWPKLSWN